MNLKKRLLPDLFFIVLLLILAYIPWKYLPELVIRGDGFVYMMSSTLKEFFSRTYWYTGFETSAAVLGSILPKLYKTNISSYFYTSLALMMLINIIFYLLLRVITRKKIISFFGAILFAVNYFGNFDMYSQHCYCFVMERVVTAPFLLLAFLFLHKFLEKNKFKFYFISLGFYLFGLGIGHFALLFTPPFILYPFFWKIFQKKKSGFAKNIFTGFFIGLSFLMISAFIVLIQQIHESGQKPKDVVAYVLNPQGNKYPEKIIRQLVYWSQYEPVFQNIDKPSLHGFLSIKHAAKSTPYIVVLYAIVTFIVYKKLPLQRALLLTTVFATAIIFYLSAWFGQYDVLYQPGANRYLYFPTFLLAIFWMLFLWVLWKSQHVFLKSSAIILIIIYYLLNWLLLRDTFRDVLSWDRSTKLTYKYMTSMRTKLPKGTLVVAPYPEVGVYESQFFTQQIGKGEVEFIGEENPYRDWNKVATLSATVIKLNYDKKCDCIKEQKLK